MAGGERSSEHDDGLFDAAKARRDARGSLQEAVASAKHESLLIFELGDHLVGVLADHIHEVTNPELPIPLPQAPAHVRGLVLVGERILAQVDLVRFLGLEKVESHEEGFGRMLVVEVGADRVALLCGRVRGLTERPVRAILAPSVLTGTALAPYLRGELHESDGVIGLLDLEALLDAAAVR